MLAHEKLHVYRQTLTFVAATSVFASKWDNKHAVTDQFNRASESLVLNLAEAARFRSAPGKLRALDFAIGSCLECAACLDVAVVKRLMDRTDCIREKKRLCDIAKMMFGLRRVWETWKVHEDAPSYGAAQPREPSEPLFHHETLDVYVAALTLMEWFVSLPVGKDPSCRLGRRIDECATSILLNIAEGNGRYSQLDHRHFLDVAEGSAVKTAAYLDVAVQSRVLLQAECGVGKELLGRILAMLSRM